MGLIEIRSRTERLGNLGGVRETDMQTGAARAYAGMADAIAQEGKANRALAGGIAGLADDAKKLAIRFAEAQERRANEEADRYVARFQEGMNDYENGYTDADGNRVAGAMEATPDDTGAWMGANVDYRDRFGAQLRNKLKMSDRAMEIARKRLVGYNLSAQKRWAGRAASLDQARRKADGIARENAATEALMNLDGTSDAASRLCWEEWKESGENSLEIAGIPKDSPAAKEMLRKRALGVLGRRLEGRIAATAESVADLPPDQAKTAFDQLSAELAEDNIVATLAPDAEFRDGKGGVVADYMRESLGDAPLSEFAKAAAKDVDLARRKAVHEAETREREARQTVVQNFMEKELALRDLPQEQWSDMYDEMGRDEALKKADPVRAMRYRDTAREMREAEAAARASEKARVAKAKEKAAADAAKAMDDAAKAKIKANEDGLAAALCQLQVMELEGSVSQEAANEAQAAIWRKFRTCTLGRTVSPSFMQSFRSRMETRLSDQEANAMRRFYRAFGYTGEVASDGEIAASDRKANADVDYYAPRKPGDRHSDNYFRIPAAELFKYGDSLLLTLRALGPDMNRQGVVEREIARLRTDWMKGAFDRNRDATVRSVMDMQREARATWDATQTNERRTGDEGKRDGSTAK